MMCAYQYGNYLYVSSQEIYEIVDVDGKIMDKMELNENGKYTYLDFWGVETEYKNSHIEYYERGRVVYYGNNLNMCVSSFLIPGTALLPTGFLAICYALSLIYLFLGISIISDIFMGSIESITSQTVTIDIKNEQGEVVKQKKVLSWNPTVANLTLMALGSSAPEIILALYETISSMDGCPGELGASTIVGSAAFNLLVISGLSIFAVDEACDQNPDRDPKVPLGVKKIYDMGVYSITATFSVLSYVWMFIVLYDQNV